MAKEKPVAINQYFKETLNRLSTSINLTDPLGLQMSAAFDKYVEKVIKPIYPIGSKIRQASSVDDAAGMRYVDWSFRDANDKIATAVQAAVDNFVRGWGAQRGLLDDKGNPVPGQGAVPMQVSGITPQIFSGTRTRILNPRTAASVGGQAVRSGGTFSTDKNTGVSTWSVPDAALTWDGKNLTKSLRAQVREGDKRWLDGRVALSSLAEGASPATPEERAIAMNSRNFRVMLARHKAMTPEQSLEEFKLNLQRRRQQAQFQREYEESHPNDPVVQAKMQRVKQRQAAKTKQKVRKVQGAARHMITLVLGTIATAAVSAVSLLTRIFAGITGIGQEVRRQVMSDAKLNFDAGTVRGWERFAESRGFAKDTLVSAAGGIAEAWGSPLKFSSANFNDLAPYLKEGTLDLVRMASSGGERNVLGIMSAVIDNLVGKSLQGTAGTHSGWDAPSAYAENLRALSSHNAAWGDLMAQYWNDLRDPDSEFHKAVSAAQGRGEQVSTDARSWITQGTWNPAYQTGSGANGLSNMTVQQAAINTMTAVASLKTSLSALKTDALERLVGGIAQTVEDFRASVVGMLSRFFPAFAMKEQERVVFMNAQARMDVERRLPGSRETANQVLSSIGVIGGVDAFAPVFEKLINGDISAFDAADVPGDAIRALSADPGILMGALAAYYRDVEVQQKLDESDAKVAAGKTGAVVVYNPSTNGTMISSDVMRAQRTLDQVAERWLPVRRDTAVGVGEAIVAQGIVELNALVGGKFLPNARETDLYFDAVKRYREARDDIKLHPAGKNYGAGPLSGTRDFELAEDALRDKLVEARKLGWKDEVMKTYDQLIALYDQYGYLSRQTDNNKAAETRHQLAEHSGNWIFGDTYRRLTSVFTPDEAIHILRYQKDQFDATQARDTSPAAKGARQVTANQMAPVLSFVDQIEQAAAQQKLETINQFLSSGEMGERRSAFIDVDEQALQEGRTAITNVYFDFGNGKQIKVLSHENTGIRQDRRITASHELLQALLTAFNPQEPNK